MYWTISWIVAAWLTTLYNTDPAAYQQAVNDGYSVTSCITWDANGKPVQTTGCDTSIKPVLDPKTGVIR